jgi:hypothetical protein
MEEVIGSIPIWSSIGPRAYDGQEKRDTQSIDWFSDEGDRQRVTSHHWEHGALELTRESTTGWEVGSTSAPENKMGHGVKWFAVLIFFGIAMPFNSGQRI